MAKVRGTSNVPLVLGIVGGALGLPSSICSSVCAGVFDTGGEIGLAGFYLYGTAITSIALIVVSCLKKKIPKFAGGLMLLGTALGGFLFACSFNILGIIAMLLTLIGGILSLVQKTEVVE